jgi:hypothetical protein
VVGGRVAAFLGRRAPDPRPVRRLCVATHEGPFVGISPPTAERAWLPASGPKTSTSKEEEISGADRHAVVGHRLRPGGEFDPQFGQTGLRPHQPEPPAPSRATSASRSRGCEAVRSAPAGS